MSAALGSHPIHEGFNMSNDHKIQNHPAYKRASHAGNRASYYLQVLYQNLHHFYDQVPVDPCEVDEQEVLRGTTFMVEEAVEYNSAKTLEDKLDALVDVVIVALGRAAFHGFHRFDEAMSRVVEANMRKVPGPSPRRGEWSRDLSKPEGWRPADLTDLVQPSRIVSSESPGDEPLDEDEIEVLEGFRRRCASDMSTSEIEYIVSERERLIKAAETHDEKENLSARVITDLRERIWNITIEKDNFRAERDAARSGRNTFREERDAARDERDDYQRQLRDEIGRCHELRGSNANLREMLNEDSLRGRSVEPIRSPSALHAADEVPAVTCVDSASSMLTEILRRVIDLREKLKAQIPGELGSMSSADRRRMSLILEAEIVLTEVELHADSPMRTPIQVEYSDVGVKEPSIKLDEIHPVLLECAQLLNRKGQDYGNQDHAKKRYHPLGHHSYIQMMHNKMTRIRHTALELKPGQTLNFDSVKDSVLDLINYSAFYGAWLKELEKTNDNR